MNKLFLLVLIPMIFASRSRAQQIFMHKIEHPNGIQAHDIYSVYQDSKHYLWFTTDGGIWRFDGKNYKNYTTEYGLPDNVVFAFCEDHQGRLWFNTYSSKIAYIEKDKVYTLPCNDSLSQLKKREIPASIYIDRKGVIWVSYLRSQDYITIAPPYKKENIHTSRIKYEFFAIEIEPGGMIAGSGTGTPAESQRELTVFKNGTAVASDTIRAEFVPGPRVSCYQQRDSTMLISAHTILWEYKNERLRKKVELPYSILSALKDVDSNYWISTIDGGLYFYRSNDTAFVNPEIYLKGKSVGRILQDHQGGFWITTLNDGIYHIPHIDLHVSESPNGLNNNISFVFSHANDKLFHTDVKGNLFITQNDSLRKAIYVNVQPDIVNRIKYIFPLTGNTYLFLGRNSFQLDFQNQKISFIPILKGTTAACSNGKTLWITKQFRLFRIQQNNLLIEREKDIKTKINCIFSLNEDILWLGTERGLLNYNFKNDILLPTPISIRRQSIISIEQLNHSQYLIIYKSDGILIVNMNLNTVRELTVNIKGYSIKHTTKDRFGNIWISTNKGVLKIDSSLQIRHIHKHHGLPSNIINAISTDSNFVYVASEKGLLKFPIQKDFRDTVPPDIYLNSVLVNNLPYPSDPVFHLPYDKNFIKISFTAINHRSYDEMIFRYKMEGIDANWKTTQNDEIEYTTLPPGDYHLTIYAVNEDGVASFKRIRLHFIIDPPFWKTWWFILAISLLFLAIVLITFKWQIAGIRKRTREKSELQEQLSQMEMQALRSQMNPHFIFNAMNSIQHYILSNEPVLANKFLVKFAKLIRNVLEHSKQELIRLSEEIETLRFYIELEALRFEDSFVYSINILDQTDPQHVKIPPLILQPYVENAIWHGLLLQKGKKELLVNISEKEGYLVIEIDDNGIGREAFPGFKKRETEKKSLGMEITKNRLSILGKSLGLKPEIQVVDKKGPMQESLGTTVIIKIPVIKNKHDKSSNY